MSTASSANGLLNNIELAKKDLAMYAAIIGHKPEVEPPKVESPRIESTEEAPAPKPEPVEASHLESEVDHHPYRISIWMRHVSHEAKKRINEAKVRLAS